MSLVTAFISTAKDVAGKLEGKYHDGWTNPAGSGDSEKKEDEEE